MSINATLVVQLIVFLILIWFTMKYVWPPIAKALDERAVMIKEGLEAAEKAKVDSAQANQKIELELAKARVEVSGQLSDAESRAESIVEDAKLRAVAEADKILLRAQTEVESQIVQARESLRDQVAVLAVKGAEQILRKEVNAQAHADLLNQLKTEL